MLTSGRVAERKAGPNQAKPGEDEEAVAGGFQTEKLVIVKPGDGLELGVGGPVVEGEDVSVPLAGLFVSADDGEGGLSAVVRQEEVAGGGGAAPRAADGAAAQEKFGGQADEDLPDDDLIGETGEERRRSWCYGVRHGRRLGA